MFLFAQSEKFGKNAISKVGKESKPTNKGSPPHPVGSSQGSTMKLVCSTLCSRCHQLVAQLDDLCYFYLDFSFDLLYFPIKITEKYSIVLCQGAMGGEGRLGYILEREKLKKGSVNSELMYLFSQQFIYKFCSITSAFLFL